MKCVIIRFCEIQIINLTLQSLNILRKTQLARTKGSYVNTFYNVIIYRNELSGNIL